MQLDRFHIMAHHVYRPQGAHDTCIQCGLVRYRTFQGFVFMTSVSNRHILKAEPKCDRQYITKMDASLKRQLALF